MNKLILPVILGVFVLFFSGKSISNKNCGPTINIVYSPYRDNIQIAEIRVINSLGQTTVYTNPSFPITYNGTGGLFTVAVILRGREHFAIWSYTANGDECNVVNYHNSVAGSLQFNTNCNEYLVTISGTDSSTNGICP